MSLQAFHPFKALTPFRGGGVLPLAAQIRRLFAAGEAGAVIDYEAALTRMAQPDYDGPATVLDADGNEIPNPAAVLWESEWNAAAQLVGLVSAETVALHALRHPPEPEPVIKPEVQQ